MLSRLYVEVREWPAWQEQIRVLTWPRGTEGLSAVRDFHVFNERAEQIIAGSSRWLIIGMENRKPQRIDFIREMIGPVNEKAATETEPGKLILPDHMENISRHVCHLSEIDYNGHVNTSCYLTWMINTIPEDHYKNRNIRAFQLNFLSETKLNEVVNIMSGPDRECFSATAADGGKELFRGRIWWNQ